MLHRCGIILFCPCHMDASTFPPLPPSLSPYPTAVASEVSADNLCKIYICEFRVSSFCLVSRVSLDSLDSHMQLKMHVELSHFWRWCSHGAVVLWCCGAACFHLVSLFWSHSVCLCISSVCVCVSVCGPIYTISLW